MKKILTIQTPEKFIAVLKSNTKEMIKFMEETIKNTNK